MNKKLLLVYIVFVSYSLISMLFNRSVTLDFFALFQLQGDLLLVMIFNMLGVFPLYYLLVVSTYENQPFYVYLLFGLSFMLGAFATIPGFLLLKGKQKTLTKFQERAFIFIPLILLLMTITGVVFGDISYYSNLFINDQFVHIMTIDFFILLLMPYLMGAQGFPYVHLISWRQTF